MTTAVPARHEGLDALRGIAVMGILAMNILAFGLPFQAYANPAAAAPPGSADLVAWFISFVFIDAKMRGVFSILFGASTLLVIESAAAAGRSAAGAHYSRMVWLAVFGLAHFYLIWFGDILFLYAICGLLLFFFRNLSVKALILWAIAFLAVGFLLFTSGWATMALAEAGRLPPETTAAMREGIDQMNRDMGAASPAYAEEVAHYLGSYASIVADRTGEMLAFPFVSIGLFIWETMGLMLIGMALFKTHMLTGAWESARYRRWAVICFAIAVPPLLLLAAYQYSAGFSGVAVFGSVIALSVPFDVVMAIGWAALMMWLIRTRFSPAIRARLAATGRMAFTNYLMTSLVMTTIFYGYGLALFGSVPRVALYLFCIGMWAAMLLWSKPWLERFQYGPFEWLWRSLSRWQIQSMKREGPG